MIKLGLRFSANNNYNFLCKNKDYLAPIRVAEQALRHDLV